MRTPAPKHDAHSSRHESKSLYGRRQSRQGQFRMPLTRTPARTTHQSKQLPYRGCRNRPRVVIGSRSILRDDPCGALSRNLRTAMNSAPRNSLSLSMEHQPVPADPGRQQCCTQTSPATSRPGRGRPGWHRQPRSLRPSPRQLWKVGFRAAVRGAVIAAAADGLTSAQEAAYARGVRVDHRATLMAAVFKEVNTGSGES